MAKIVFINPKFSTSFWGVNYALPFLRKKGVGPVTSFPLLAALTPDEHEVRIFDEAVEDIDYEEVAKADIVGLTGMIVQREKMREIAERVKQLGKFLVVGGPWITVQEDYLKDLADVIFVGEADQTWPVFIQQWQNGSHLTRYEQQQRTDMTSLPAPRYDLLKLDRYLQGSVQISRGCPFLCEFCDIIVTFGRKPRFKTASQVIQELEDWRRSGLRTVFLVDDNLIGNRKEIIPVLTQVAQWQQEHQYPLNFHTEASINLADDEELLDLFVAANIRTVFVGIESPNAAALAETRKMQNINRRDRQADSSSDSAELFLLEKVWKIQDKGIEVTCGLILGFDSDQPDIFEAQRSFIAQSRIITAMIGLLSAIPKTPLYERLKAANRLDENDPPAFGTNVIPLGMSREQLSDGFIDFVRSTYEPEAYFERVDDLYIRCRYFHHSDTVRAQYISRWTKIKRGTLAASWAFLVFSGFLLKLDNRELRNQYVRRLFNFIKSRPHPERVLGYINEILCHYHFYRYSQDMANGQSAIVSTM